MTNRLFIDNNIWVYALSGQSEEREQKARAFINGVIINAHPVISYQVVNETMRVLKKLGNAYKRRSARRFFHTRQLGNKEYIQRISAITHK
jgi:predicted nucleic acid-binding protein